MNKKKIAKKTKPIHKENKQDIVGNIGVWSVNVATALSYASLIQL